MGVESGVLGARDDLHGLHVEYEEGGVSEHVSEAVHDYHGGCLAVAGSARCGPEGCLVEHPVRIDPHRCDVDDGVLALGIENSRFVSGHRGVAFADLDVACVGEHALEVVDVDPVDLLSGLVVHRRHEHGVLRSVALEHHESVGEDDVGGSSVVGDGDADVALPDRKLDVAVHGRIRILREEASGSAVVGHVEESVVVVAGDVLHGEGEDVD